MKLGVGIVDIIVVVNGMQYVVGFNCQMLYFIIGGSVDFVFDNVNVEVLWFIELMFNSVQVGGFIFLFERILFIVMEMWEGVRWVFFELLVQEDFEQWYGYLLLVCRSCEESIRKL